MPEAAASLAARALSQIETAFADRGPPTEMSDSKQLSAAEFDAVMSFAGLRWQDIGFDRIAVNADAIFWFAPAAFAYYLPGFLAAGLREDRTDSNAYDALLGVLDRSPEPDYWDDFFLPRWTLLSLDEIDAVRAWVRWLAAREPAAFTTISVERIDGTLTLLQMHAADRAG